MAYKWGTAPKARTVAFYHRRVGEVFAGKVARLGLPWEQAVWHPDARLTRDDLQRLEDELLATGVRFEMSASVSVNESPEKYAAAAVEEVAAGEADDRGRVLVGSGDNVFSAADVTGTARFISDVDTVMDMLDEGVPENTVAIIDDSGGTLTAPILEGFDAVVCKGGSVRSHLGILTREYQIPCLMNAQVSGLEEGDRVQVEFTASPPTVYSDEAAAPRARVWKLPGDRTEG